MQRIDVRELCRHASRYLAIVKAGHTVEISEYGTVVALMVPSSCPQTARDRLVAAGRLIPAPDPTGRVHVPCPVPTTPGEPGNQQLLDAASAERL